MSNSIQHALSTGGIACLSRDDICQAVLLEIQLIWLITTNTNNTFYDRKMSSLALVKSFSKIFNIDSSYLYQRHNQCRDEYLDILEAKEMPNAA